LTLKEVAKEYPSRPRALPMPATDGDEDSEDERGTVETSEAAAARRAKELKACEVRGKARVSMVPKSDKAGRQAAKAAAALEKAELEARHEAEEAEEEARAGRAGGASIGNAGGEEEDEADVEAAAEALARLSTMGAATPPCLGQGQGRNQSQGSGQGQGQGGARKVSKSQRRREAREREDRERDRRIAAEKAGQGPSAREEEDAHFARTLGPMGLRVAEMAADGHCLFRAIAHQLAYAEGGAAGGQPDTAAAVEIRKVAAGQLRRGRALYEPFVLAGAVDDPGPPIEYEAYCARVESTAEWGGQAELQAIAAALGKRIEVHSAGMPVVVMGDDDSPARPRDPRDVLRVSYHRAAYGLGEHYNSVVRA